MYNQADLPIPLTGNEDSDEFYAIIPLNPLVRVIKKYSKTFKSLSKEQLENLKNMLEIILSRNPVIKENIKLKNKYEKLLNLIQEEKNA